MALNFDGKDYQTIADVKERFRVSEKSLKRWIKDGYIPDPQMESIGGRNFRHYTEEWCEHLQIFLNKKKLNGK